MFCLSSLSLSLCHNTATVMASSSLEDVPSVDLMSELLRRFKCSSKPDKRLILVGNFIHLSLSYSTTLCFLFRSELTVSCFGMLIRFLGFSFLLYHLVDCLCFFKEQDFFFCIIGDSNEKFE